MKDEKVINQFKEYCQGMVSVTPALTIPEPDYLPTVRMFFRVLSTEINRLAKESNDIEHLSASLKEVAWNTLEKYRDDFLSRN